MLVRPLQRLLAGVVGSAVMTGDEPVDVLPVAKRPRHFCAAPGVIAEPADRPSPITAGSRDPLQQSRRRRVQEHISSPMPELLLTLADVVQQTRDHQVSV